MILFPKNTKFLNLGNTKSMNQCSAHFTITQKLIHYDLIVTRERDYEY